MLTSICPLGERARNQRYPVTVFFYVAGSVLAGVALGALLGGVGSLALAAVDGGGNDIAIWVVAVSAVAGLAADRRWRGSHLPGPARQVNENWLVTYRGWVYGGGFGVQLGLGITTFVVASAVYVVLAGAFASGSAIGGAVVGGAFGLSRALPIFVAADIRDHARLKVRMRRIQGRLPAVHTSLLLTQGAVGIAAVVLAIGGMA